MSQNIKLGKRKMQTIRMIIQILSTFLLSYGAIFFGENINLVVPVFQCVYVKGRTANGICKTLTKGSEIFQNMTPSTLLPLAVMLISLLILGRIWCGYICPFGLFQNILTHIRKTLRIPPIIIPDKGKPIVKLIKWGLLLCLLFGIGFCKLCPVKYIALPFSGSFPGFNLWGIGIAGVLCGLCFLKENAFCLICPLGTLMGLLSKLSLLRIKKKGTACTHCRACLEVCPMGIKSIYQLRNQPDVTHPDCIFCMKCIDCCPEDDALSLTILNTPILSSKREK